VEEMRVYVEAFELAYSNHSVGSSYHNRLTIIVDVTGHDAIGVQKALTYAGALMGGRVYGLQVRYHHRVPDGSCYTLVPG
jgi:hypothetical protein